MGKGKPVVYDVEISQAKKKNELLKSLKDITLKLKNRMNELELRLKKMEDYIVTPEKVQKEIKKMEKKKIEIQQKLDIEERKKEIKKEALREYYRKKFTKEE